MRSSGKFKWERFAAASGIAFVVLLVVGYVLLVMSWPQNVDASAQEIGASFSVVDQTLAYVGDHLIRLGLIFALFFMGSLWSALRSGEGGTGWLSALAFASGTATSVLLLGGIAALDVAAHELEEGKLAPEPARVLSSIGFYSSIVLTSVTLTVFLAATAIVTLRTRTLPRWLGQASAVLAVLFLVASLLEFPVFFIYPLLLLWVVATSVVLLRRVGGV